MLWPAALINIIGQKNVAITGTGIIDSQGKPFWDSFHSVKKEYEQKKLRWALDYDVNRQRTLLVDGSWDIMINDVTFQRAARSEERRVGKACISTSRSRGSPTHYKKNIKLQ